MSGCVGFIKDFHFDDEVWVVRYVVVDTGTWLANRLVLLAPHAFSRLEVKSEVLHSHLTTEEIETVPAVDAPRPISHQFEVDYYDHYGWPAYWDGGAMWGIGAFPGMMPRLELEALPHSHRVEKEDRHLRSARAVAGYAIESSYGQIGVVNGIIVNDRSWAIRRLVVAVGVWLSKRKAQVSVDKIARISFEESKIFVSTSKEYIRTAAEGELVKASTGGSAGFQG